MEINPNRINTFKELPSSNHLVEAADTPYSQAAAIREVVATTTGGAIEPKKSILDIARSFVLTAINPAVKDWWARRVSLDQLEAIAANWGLTGQETMLRDNILSEITRESSVDNLAINAPEYKEPAAPRNRGNKEGGGTRLLHCTKNIGAKNVDPTNKAGRITGTRDTRG